MVGVLDDSALACSAGRVGHSNVRDGCFAGEYSKLLRVEHQLMASEKVAISSQVHQIFLSITT